MKNKDIAEIILQYIGGENNVKHFTHCATRLRFNLYDDTKMNLEKLKLVESVIGAQSVNGQLQIIVGGKVVALFDELSKIIKINPSTEVEKGKKKNPLAVFVETISSIFSPILPVLLGCGISRALLMLAAKFGWIANTSDLYTIINMMGNVIFYFMPFFLAVSAAEKFKTHKYLALCLAGILMNPLILSAVTEKKTFDFLGMMIEPKNYSSTIIPIILSVWIMSYIYKFINRYLPEIIKSIFTPVLTLLIMLPLMLLVLGPIGYILGEQIASLVQQFYNSGGIVSAFIVGFLRSPLILFGMHYAIQPIQIQEIAQNGYSLLFPTALVSNFAQCAAAFAVAVLVKNKAEKSGAFSSSFSAFLGITEPAMFGYNLKYKIPFLCSCFAAGISSAYLRLFNARTLASGLPGILTIGNYEADPSFQIYIGVILAMVISFGLTMFIGLDGKRFSKKKNEVEVIEITDKESKQVLIMQSPLKGEVKQLADVEDKVFSQELIGKGVAILPTEGIVYAPFDGEVLADFKSKHAIGIRSIDGVEVLIHVGVDTINLEGLYYTSKYQKGDHFKKGEVLIIFDINAIVKEGYDIITPVVVTNANEFTYINRSNDEEIVDQASDLLTMKR